MGRPVALRAEILGTRHESGSEKLLPDAVDGHPRGKRILRRDQPASQIDAAGLFGLIGGPEPRRESRFDLNARGLVASPEVDVILRGSIRDPNGLGLAERGQRIVERAQLLREIRVAEIGVVFLGQHPSVLADEEIRQRLLVAHGATLRRSAQDPLAQIHVGAEFVERDVPLGGHTGVVGRPEHLRLPRRLPVKHAVLREQVATCPLIARQGLQVRSALAWQRRVDVLFLQFVEEREEAVVVALRERIVLVVVALRATDGQAEPYRSDRVRAVDDLLEPPFLGVGAALGIRGRVAMKARGDKLVDVALRQEIARDLLERELVEGHVAVEGLNDPVPVAPGVRPEIVAAKAVAVRVAGEIQPVTGPLLGIVRGVQQAVDQSFVSFGTLVCEERLDICKLWRQSSQVEAQPPDQRVPRRPRSRLDALAFQPRQHESIYGVANPRLADHLGKSRALDRAVGPVRDFLDRLIGGGRLRPVRSAVDPST